MFEGIKIVTTLECVRHVILRLDNVRQSKLTVINLSKWPF